ncbi:DUF4205-containing protein [Aureococcus anophagefferens]|nr:DUF4205-containing protein [Aureococcus anophagefferens]
MGGDEWWLGRELRALLEARAAEKAEQCCEGGVPDGPDAPEKAEKGPPAPAPVRASAARRARRAVGRRRRRARGRGAERWLSPAQAFALLRAERGRDARLAALPVRDTASPAEASAAACYSVVNSYVHWLEEHPTIGVAVCQMSRSKRKPYRSRERKELLEDGYDESQDRIVSHGLTGRMYKLLPAGQRRCEKKPTRGGALEALEGSSIVQIFIDEAAARFLGPARSRPAARPFRPPPPADYPTPRRFAVPAGASYGGLGYGYDGPRLAAYYAAHFPTRGAPPRRGPTAPRRSSAAQRRRRARRARRRDDVQPRPQRRGAAHLRGRAALGRDPSNAARHTFDGAPAPPRHPAYAGRAAASAAPSTQQPGAAHGDGAPAQSHPVFFDGAPPRSRHPAYPYERRGADPVCLFFDGARSGARSARPPTRRRRRARVAGSPGDPFSPG